MSSDEQEIRQLVATWIEATKAEDLPTILSLMTEDVVFLMPGRPPMFGRAAFEAAASSQAKSQSSQPKYEGASEIQEIQIVGDWAFMWTRLSMVLTPQDGSPPMARAGHTLSVLQKQNGKWLLARDANMLAPVPTAATS